MKNDESDKVPDFWTELKTTANMTDFTKQQEQNAVRMASIVSMPFAVTVSRVMTVFLI
jgi:hypothetical protein